MNYSGQIYPENTVGYFRIASSTGRQPVEPVTEGEFLIGSGAQCQLRFGDHDIPEVHTVLSVQQDTVMLTCQHSRPALRLNGQQESECKLADGDLIEIGSHRMLFRMVSAANRITLDEDEFSTANLPITAEGLVDRLDEQIHLVEELNQTPDQAVMELLHAARRANEQEAVAATSSSSAELTEVKELIQKQHEASRIRLESLTEVLDNVVKQQKLIADTLEVLSERVQGLDAATFSQRRASA